MATYGRQNFQMHFLERKLLSLYWDFTAANPKDPVKKISLDLDNCLAPHKQQAITLTNDDQVHWCIYMYQECNIRHQWFNWSKWVKQINSLSPRKYDCDFKCLYFIHNVGIDILCIQINIALEWMPEGSVDGKSILVQVMVWSPQATSHYLSQCWLSSMLPYGITRLAIWHIYITCIRPQ